MISGATQFIVPLGRHLVRVEVFSNVFVVVRRAWPKSDSIGVPSFFIKMFRFRDCIKRDTKGSKERTYSFYISMNDAVHMDMFQAVRNTESLYDW